MNLTESQLKAVKADKGYYLVNAGAGSGKTSSFTARIEHLVNSGTFPEKILALTFTNEAATSMREKLQSVIGVIDSEKVNIMTFHSFAYRTLKAYYPERYQNKKIIQQWWKMQQLYDLVGRRSDRNPFGLTMGIKAGDLAQFISYQKANMIKHGMSVLVDDNVGFVRGEPYDKLQTAFDTYCRFVENARVIEFDDMLVDLYYNLLSDNELLIALRNKFDYIMIDEFQDTNTINLEIVKLLERGNLFVVGDFRQGIYGFINANISNILNFDSMFKSSNIIQLSENWRSTNEIVNVCNKVIESSPDKRYKKFSPQIAARNIEGKPVTLTYFDTEFNEVKSIANEILEQIENNDENKRLSDFAILCRTNADLGLYESAFADLQIPVNISGNRSFFERKEINDLLSYCRHIVDERDDMSLRRIINIPSRFIPKTLVADLDEYSYSNEITLERAMETHNIPDRNKKAIFGLVANFKEWRSDMDKINAEKLLKKVYLSIGYKEHLNKITDSRTELTLRENSIEKLFEMSRKFSSIKTFLAHIEMIKLNNKTKDEDAVNLMTVHSSKGLEFDTCFIHGVTAENFPHAMCTDTEEERRLLYVALSRAKNTLKLYANLFNSNGNKSVEICPFLADTFKEQAISARRKCLNEQQSVEVILH